MDKLLVVHVAKALRRADHFGDEEGWHHETYLAQTAIAAIESYKHCDDYGDPDKVYTPDKGRGENGGGYEFVKQTAAFLAPDKLEYHTGCDSYGCTVQHTVSHENGKNYCGIHHGGRHVEPPKKSEADEIPPHIHERARMHGDHIYKEFGYKKPAKTRLNDDT